MRIPRALVQSPCRALHPPVLRHQLHHQPRQGQGQQQQERAAGEQEKGSALPAPGEGEPVPLDVSGGGTTIKLGELGPLVVNGDGTTGRVNNWTDMTAAERETTLRLLSRRNKARLEALKAKERSTGAKGGGSGSA